MGRSGRMAALVAAHPREALVEVIGEALLTVYRFWLNGGATLEARPRCFVLLWALSLVVRNSKQSSGFRIRYVKN